MEKMCLLSVNTSKTIIFRKVEFCKQVNIALQGPINSLMTLLQSQSWNPIVLFCWKKLSLKLLGLRSWNYVCKCFLESISCEPVTPRGETILLLISLSSKKTCLEMVHQLRPWNNFCTLPRLTYQSRMRQKNVTP